VRRQFRPNHRVSASKASARPMPTKYTVEIDDALAERLEEAARAAKVPATDLIAECVAQHLEIAIRHRALVDRLDLVDQGLLELAGFIGEATASPKVDLSSLCRYAHPKE
jgi:predicted transcriptional regulator